MRMIAIIFKALLIFLSLSASAEPELLSVEEAFKPKVTIQDNKVQVIFDIAKDYYLYKDKINVTALDQTQLGQATFSKAKIKNDEFFGKVSIYRRTAKVSYPIVSSDDNVKLEISYQGCADLGVCFPPANKVVTLFNAARINNSTNFFQTLKTQSNVSDPTTVDTAFVFEAFKKDENNITALWKIRDNYYLYNDKFKFSIKGAKLGEITLPQGEQKTDDFFGDTVVHKKQLEVNIPVKNVSQRVELTVGFQGCWEGGVCYPPSQKVGIIEMITPQSTQVITEVKKPVDKLVEQVIVKVDKLVTAISPSAQPSTVNKAQNTLNLEQKVTQLVEKIMQKNQQSTTALAISEQIKNKPQQSTTEVVKNNNNKNIIVEQNEEQKVASLFTGASVAIVLFTFFIFGLGLSFTPCVLPMIPILSSIIIGQKANNSKSSALLMSAVFVLFMALAYTIFGILAGLFGSNLQIILQTPWVLIAFSLVFVALAFSMFGYFEIKTPNWLNSKLTMFSNKQTGGNLVSVAIMGFLSALIIGPCVAPPLAGSLIYIGQTGDAVLGGTALFIMSIGMGIPLILIGAGISKAPKTGAWMDGVKYVFGVVMLGMAIYLLERIVSEIVVLTLWAALLTIAPIVLGVTTNITTSTPWQRVFKVIGMIILGYGILLWLLVARGGGDMFAPLQNVNANANFISQQKISFTTVKNLTEFNKVINNTDKLVMLDFYADWCVYCKVYEKEVFTDPRVSKLLNTMLNVRIDITKNTKQDQELMKAFNVNAPPVLLFFKNGKELISKRVVGEKNAEEFFAILEKIL